MLTIKDFMYFKLFYAEMAQGTVIELFDFSFNCLVSALLAHPLLSAVQDGLATGNARQEFGATLAAGCAKVRNGSAAELAIYFYHRTNRLFVWRVCSEYIHCQSVVLFSAFL